MDAAHKASLARGYRAAHHRRRARIRLQVVAFIEARYADRGAIDTSGAGAIDGLAQDREGGQLWIGDKGMLLAGTYAENPRLLGLGIALMIWEVSVRHGVRH